MSDFSSLAIDRDDNIVVVSLAGNVGNTGNPNYGCILYKELGNSVIHSVNLDTYCHPNEIAVSNGDNLDVEITTDKNKKRYVTFTGKDSLAYYFSFNPFQTPTNPIRLTPGRSGIQGEKKTNPFLAPAWNKGIYIVWEDNFNNPGIDDYDVWLKSIDGAEIGRIYDINSDDTVSMADLLTDSKYYSQKQGSPSWKHCTDMNGDGVVNILDLVLISVNMD